MGNFVGFNPNNCHLHAAVMVKYYQRVVSLILGGSIILWIQGNVIVWNYGVFDGRIINWTMYSYRGVIDSTIWVVALFLVFIKYQAFYKKLKQISVFFIILQLLSMSILFIQKPTTPSNKKFDIDKSENTLFQLIRM